MNSRVRVVKRGTVELRQQPAVESKRENGSSEREIASTIKSWIAESAQRRRADEQRAFARLKPVPL